MWPGDALPQHGITNWSVFTGEKGALTSGFKSWMKPPGCKWVFILAVGAGGGGGRPANGNITVAGGGGGSGSITRALFPAQMFPDIIFVRPGTGGLGATSASGAGGTGFNSYISIAPNITAQNAIFIFSPGAGGAAAATPGGGGAVTVTSSGIWINSAIFTSVAGQTGGAGASLANTVGSSIAFGSAGLFIGGGAGGGNGTGAGGNITGGGPLPTILGGDGSAGSDDSGKNGFNQGLIISPGLRTFPMLFSGGSGGGGTNGFSGGNGGSGGYGSGGGGGGGGTNAGATSGNGGDGGDALIMIGAF